jgi:hypothetical protein
MAAWKPQDSAQSGSAIPGFEPMKGCCQGFSMGDSQEELGRLYLAEKLGQKVLKKHFALDAGLDCYYPNNYTHAEMRGGAPFMRPTFASKHVLKSAVESGAFHDAMLAYGYHGTPACNLASILKQGLKPSKCGVLRDGLYFSPSPLYAQLYSTSAYHCGPGSPIETWSTSCSCSEFRTNCSTAVAWRKPPRPLGQNIAFTTCFKEQAWKSQTSSLPRWKPKIVQVLHSKPSLSSCTPTTRTIQRMANGVSSKT